MPIPRFEVPAGLINDVNKVFTVSMPYAPGSTAVFLNGLLQDRTLTDGWVETNPGAGIVTLNEAPRSTMAGPCDDGPDVVQIFFLDLSPVLPETQIFRMKGTIKTQRRLHGSLLLSVPILGRITPPKRLHGSIDPRKPLRGDIRTQKLKATIKVCS